MRSQYCWIPQIVRICFLSLVSEGVKEARKLNTGIWRGTGSKITSNLYYSIALITTEYSTIEEEISRFSFSFLGERKLFCESWVWGIWPYLDKKNIMRSRKFSRKFLHFTIKLQSAVALWQNCALHSSESFRWELRTNLENIKVIFSFFSLKYCIVHSIKTGHLSVHYGV